MLTVTSCSRQGRSDVLSVNTDGGLSVFSMFTRRRVPQSSLFFHSQCEYGSRFVGRYLFSDTACDLGASVQPIGFKESPGLDEGLRHHGHVLFHLHDKGKARHQPKYLYQDLYASPRLL